MTKLVDRGDRLKVDLTNTAANIAINRGRGTVQSLHDECRTDPETKGALASSSDLDFMAKDQLQSGSGGESLSVKSFSSTSLARVNSRSTSTPITNARFSNPTESSRYRAMASSPFRARSMSLRIGGLPRPQRESNGQRASLGSLMPMGTPSSLSPAYHDRPALSALTAMRPRKRHSLARTYIADPRSELDVAIGNIVNKLNVRFRFFWTCIEIYACTR